MVNVAIHRVRLAEESPPVPGRLIVRRIPDLRPQKDQGQRQLFDVGRSHAFFTTTDPADLDTVAADKIHRRHAIIPTRIAYSPEN